MKALSAAVLLHVLVVVLGSAAMYSTRVDTLELTGQKKGYGKMISLDGMSFGKKPQPQSSSNKVTTKSKELPVKTSAALSVASTVTDSTSVEQSAVAPAGAGNGGGNGSGSGSGFSFGSGTGDFDGGLLFSQIKKHFETRLGSSLVIKEDQLIKIKISLDSDGTIKNADLIQGKLDVGTLRRILSVAKNIPMKNLWKSGAPVPAELIIPLVLTSNS